MMIDAASQTPFYDYALCRALTAAGCAVELLTARFTYGELPPPEAPVREVFARTSLLPPLRRSQRLRRVARALEYPIDWALVLRHLRATRPDVVHVQWAMLPAVDAPAFRAIRRLGPRLVYTVHDVVAHEPWRRRWLSTKPLYDLADDLIVHTEANRSALAEASPLTQSKIHVVAHGNLVDCCGPLLTRDEARARLGLPPDVPIALFFGAIKPFKGLDCLIEAFPRVLERLPAARLLIAGYPTEPFARYRRAIDRLGLGGRVILKLGHVPYRDVSSFLCSADVVALPYAATSFSGVLLAAYSFGRPVVATRTGGLTEAVEEGRTGHLVPPRNVPALAAALVRVLSHPARAARQGERARELALTTYAWPAIARATLAIYEQGAPGRPPS